jgi:hypothetical protein
MVQFVDDGEVGLLDFEDQAVSSVCRICNGTRWEPVEQVVNGVLEKRVKRCRCWQPAAREKIRSRRSRRAAAMPQSKPAPTALDSKTLSTGDR